LDYLARLLEAMPAHKIEKIRALCDPKSTLYKFTDEPTRFARDAIAHCQRLGLYDIAPLSILDLGCGPGYFITAAQHAGHETVGLNAHDQVIDRFRGMFPNLRIIWNEITPGVPLPDVGRIDLVTAMGLNLCHGKHWWTQDEYQGLLDDLLPRLNDGGRINFHVNHGKETDWVCNTSLWKWPGKMWSIDNVIQWSI
jgi:SAM-dependent methyltransferase